MPKLEPIPSSGSRGGRRARGNRVTTSLAEINVVPLVDVMLVLLIIFMVAAPMMTQGFPVNLPQSRRSSPVNAPITVTVPASFSRDGRVMLGEESVPLAVLDERVRQAMGAREQKSVIYAADTVIQHGQMIAILDQLRAAGVESVSFQTQPATGR
jgi:biopolymer transport protein ExbD